VSVESAYIARPKLRFAWLWWTIGWVLVVLTINDSLERSPPQFLNVFPSDKLLHFSGYFALATWFGGVTRKQRYPIVGVLLIALGGALEIAQGLMSNGRSAEWLDFLANSLGVTIGLAIAYAGLGMWTVWIERLLGAQK
jgi:VanZ family protein